MMSRSCLSPRTRTQVNTSSAGGSREGGGAHGHVPMWSAVGMSDGCDKDHTAHRKGLQSLNTGWMAGVCADKYSLLKSLVTNPSEINVKM